ncbi:MAG TPA: shikimate dehydrogenase [Pyrinomonadaceae bacterium]|nr:shikimate dehydrogenase [Pyrinomonadaceae bacterium]
MDSSHNPRICISLCETTLAALQRAVASAAALSDLIEVRLDCLERNELAAGTGLLTKLLHDAPCEFILTFRPSQQGGRRLLDDESRHGFWSGAIFSESFFDVELDLAEKSGSSETAPSLPIDWSRTICSHHDFAGVPARLDQIYDRLAHTPARVLKIAVQAHDVTDCLAVFHLLERARNDGREMIALAMGPSGLATRILGPSRGAFLTYASLGDRSATAPGQITARELKEVYRLEKIDRQTEIFGLIGSPVSHSVSPRMHNAAFANVGANAVYIPFEVSDVKAFIKRMVHPRTRELNWNIRGLSVTAPHKSAVMDRLDWIEPAAQEIGAVNTIVVEGDALRGYNTDAQGFLQPLRQKFGDLAGARCAVIGSGGAASAALWGLGQVGAKVTVFARNPGNASALAAQFAADWNKLEGASFKGFDVIVNATPLGTARQFEDQTPALALQLRGARLAYDLVYNPEETRFLREAREAGCETLGGLAMLVGQAVEQFRLWTESAAPEDVMREAAGKAVLSSEF